jgi:hypothetical protein
MEAQIGVNAAQKGRFEDIVVKYRDPLTNTSARVNGASLHTKNLEKPEQRRRRFH